MKSWYIYRDQKHI